MSRRTSKKVTWVEFTSRRDGAIWKLEDWVSFKSTFEPIIQRDLPEFEEWAGDFEVPYNCARMRFGINPLIPPLNTDASFLRSMTTAEVAEKLKTDVDYVEYEIEQLQIRWRKYHKAKTADPEDAPAAPAPQPTVQAPRERPSTPPPSMEALPQGFVDPMSASAGDGTPLEPELMDILQQYGFNIGIFEVKGRHEAIQLEEMRAFAKRLGELRKMFDNPMSRQLARMALMNEMQLRRADDELCRIPIISSEFWNVHDKKLKLEEIYQKQWSKLEEICPYIRGAAHKEGLRACISEIIDAHAQRESNKDSSLIDEVFTAFEIQIMTRSSIQQGPLYRPGWVAAVADAKKNLYNPAYRRLLPDPFFKVMDEAYRDAHARAVEGGLLKPIDLEAEGPKGEWPPLFVPDDAPAGLENSPTLGEVGEEIPDIQPTLEDTP